MSYIDDIANKFNYQSEMLSSNKQSFSFQQFLSEKYAKAKEETIRKVMAAILNREPEMDDAKDFEFVESNCYPGIEMFAYKGILLGRLDYLSNYDEYQCKISYVFTPCSNFEEASKITPIA